MQHVPLKSISLLLLALTFATDLCISADPSAKQSPSTKNSQPDSSKPYKSPYSNISYEEFRQGSYGPVHISKFSINVSNVEPANMEADQITDGPNCHHADTNGVIRFVVIDDDQVRTRLMVHYFRLVEPSADVVAEAEAARSGAHIPVNNSTRGEMGDAAASLHMGNSSLQLLGVSDYLFEPGLFAHGSAGDAERSGEVLDDLLWSLTDEVPASVRPITCVFYGIRRVRSGIVREWLPSVKIIDMVHMGVNLSGFRQPRKSYVKDGPWLDPDQEISHLWLAINFLLGNFAIESSDVEIERRNSDVPVKPNITTNMVLDINEMTTDVIFEDIAVGGGQGENATYEKFIQAKSYISLGTRESVLFFVGYHKEDDSLDKDNRTVHKAYTTTCLAANLTTKFSFGSISDMTLIGLGGGGDNCLVHAQMIVSYYTWLYPVHVSYADTTVYTTSRAYDLIKYMYDANLGNVTQSSTVCPTDSFPCDAYMTTMGGIIRAAKKTCRDLPRKGPEMFYCINLSMFGAVLFQKLGLTQYTAVVGLGEQSAIGWPLGKSVMFLQASMP